MSEAGIGVCLDGHVCHVTLDVPEKYNAINRSMWRALRQVFSDIQTQAALRCIVLSGAAGNFCAGGDIAEYPGFRFDASALRHFHEVEVWGALEALLACDVPVVAVIDGACMGAGLELAASCDVRLSSRRARFGAPIGKLGFPMAPREAALVAGALGASVARSMLLAAEIYTPEQLAATGFLTRVVPEADLAAVQAKMVQRICGLGPNAARRNKIMLRQIQQQHETVDAYDFADAPEHREGIHAFLDKRSPVF